VCDGRAQKRNQQTEKHLPFPICISRRLLTRRNTRRHGLWRVSKRYSILFHLYGCHCRRCRPRSIENGPIKIFSVSERWLQERGIHCGVIWVGDGSRRCRNAWFHVLALRSEDMKRAFGGGAGGGRRACSSTSTSTVRKGRAVTRARHLQDVQRL
jgi:hypothetical protein